MNQLYKLFVEYRLNAKNSLNTNLIGLLAGLSKLRLSLTGNQIFKSVMTNFCHSLEFSQH